MADAIDPTTDSHSPPGRATLAVAQFAPSADRRGNLDRIGELTAEAAARGARVVVFPEYASYFVDPFDETLRANAEDLDGPFTRALTDLAAEHDVVIVAGLVERGADDHRVRNTVVAVGATGIATHYRKLHLYDAFGQRESDWVEPGEIVEPTTFEHGGVRFAVMTCYDLRFPEVARLLTDTGADVILVAAEWVRGPLKEHHWRTLLAARAIENTIYVAAADHPPPLGVGFSSIVDPRGVATAAVGTDAGVAVAVVDRSTIESVRSTNPALDLRRFRIAERES